MPGPRRPQRANGRLRYERLLDAAEAVLGRDGPQGLTIQNLAREAGVPTASAYHFFSGPVAVSLALSERYLAGFLDLVGRPVDDLESLSWQQVVAILLDRAVAFYRAHPYAQTLVLGSDHSWHIRRADLANNREMAGAIAALIGPKLPPVAPDILHQTVFIGIGVGDAVLALSIAEQGCITDAYQREALVAICGYVTNRLLGDRPA
jgi:AcrR family transcriptional regulator